MNDKNPFISVVIPAFNEEKYISTALKSLSSQSLPKNEYEVIVVDNGSSDKTAQVAQEFGAKVVKYSKIQGVSAARQAGVDSARGEIIAFTDADALLPRDWLKNIQEKMGERNVIALGGSMVPQGVGAVSVVLFTIYDLIVLLHGFFGKPMMWGNNMAVRKEAIRAIGGFNLSLSTSEDWELGLRLAKKYGSGRIKYSLQNKVRTSNRKLKGFKLFLKYFTDGVIAYFNVIILGRAKSPQMVNLR